MKGWLKGTSAHHLIQPPSCSRTVAVDELGHSFVQLCAESPKDGDPLPLSRPVTVLHRLTCEKVSPNVQCDLPKRQPEATE